MPTNNTQRLTDRYKAAIAAFNKDEPFHESRQELETLRWEERLPLVYRLRARAVLTGDFIIGCWREREEEELCLVPEQETYTWMSMVVSGSASSLEDRGIGTRQIVRKPKTERGGDTSPLVPPEVQPGSIRIPLVETRL
jgi:hypothetical protein